MRMLLHPEVNGESIALPEVDEPTGFKLRIKAGDNVDNFYLLRLDQPQPQSGEQNDENQQNDEQQDPKDDGEKKEPEPQEEKQEKEKDKQENKPRPVEDALDKLDHNPENLEAKQRARQSPLVNHPPEKDW